MINTESPLWAWILPSTVLGIVITSVAAELAFIAPTPNTIPTPAATQTPVGPEIMVAAVSPTDTATTIPTPVPTATKSPIVTATDTPTTMPPTNTPMPVPTAEATEQPSLQLPEQPPVKPSERLAPAMVVAEKGLALRYGPGVVYDPPIDYLRSGDLLDVTGRIASNDWVQVMALRLGKQGWVSASSKYVQINVDLNGIPIVKPPLAPSPTLLEPPDGTRVSMSKRLDLAWKWDGTLGATDYFQVEIWNKYNDFVTPIDVAWVKGSVYKYEIVELAYHPDYRWRITVISGIPAREKDWSAPGNRAWEPSKQLELVSEQSETWALFIEPPDHAPAPPLPDDGSHDDEHDKKDDEPDGGF